MAEEKPAQPEETPELPISEQEVQIQASSSSDKLKIHKFKILGGILGVLVLAGAVFGAYKFGKKQVQIGPQPTPTPSFPSKPEQCNDPGVAGVYHCLDGSTKVLFRALGAGFTIIREDGSQIRCPVVAPQYIKKECQEIECPLNLCEEEGFVCVDPESLNCAEEIELSFECTEEYQTWARENCPGWDENKVFCKEPRPQVCTMECILNPPYICGSNGKSHCSVCQACSNPKVEWYIIQDSPCGAD